jgi:hypothetical protein
MWMFVSAFPIVNVHLIKEVNTEDTHNQTNKAHDVSLDQL